MACCIGSWGDRRDVIGVLALAEEAFTDTGHTKAQNAAKYGLLARYAVASDVYTEAVYTDFSLDLWSAHINVDEGWLWVFYSCQTYNNDGSLACGSWNVPSLWHISKDKSDSWTVVEIREHP